MSINRREFLQTAAGAATFGAATFVDPEFYRTAAQASPETPDPNDPNDPNAITDPDHEIGKPYVGWKEGELDLHFIHTGQTENCFHILPDGTTFLLDAGQRSSKNFGKVSWYKPGKDNNAIKLNIIEKTNLQLIKSEEAARPDDPTDESLSDGVEAAPHEDWTEEAVAGQIRKYFDAVNETFAEGSNQNPFDLDKRFYSTYWNEVYDAVNDKESNVTSVEERLFVDDLHWTAGMETPLEARDIKVELLTGTTAEATLTLVDVGHGSRQKVILSLDYERGIWRISNWLEKSHDPSGSILVKMEKYIGL